MWGTKMLQKMWEEPFWGRRLALLGPVGQCVFAHSVHLLERSREYGPHVHPYQEGAGGGFKRLVAKPFVSAETLKACALIGLPPVAVRCMSTTMSAGSDWGGLAKRGGSALFRGLGAWEEG